MADDLDPSAIEHTDGSGVPDAAPADPSPSDTPPPTPAPDPRDARIASLEAQITAQTETLKALTGSLPSRTAPPPTNPMDGALMGEGGVAVPAVVVSELRQRGFSDEEIKRNGGIVMAIVTPILNAVGAPLVQEVASVRERVEMAEMARDTKNFPHFGLIHDKLAEIKQEAARLGQPIDNRTAYHIAVARNVDTIIDATSAERAAAAARAKEATAAAAGMKASTTATTTARATAPQGPITADRLRSMTPAERNAYFEAAANARIVG